jgi:hypothetical protein
VRRGGGGGRNWASAEWRAQHFAENARNESPRLSKTDRNNLLNNFVLSGKAEALLEGDFGKHDRERIQQAAEAMGLHWCAPNLA